MIPSPLAPRTIERTLLRVAVAGGLLGLVSAYSFVEYVFVAREPSRVAVTAAQEIAAASNTTSLPVESRASSNPVQAPRLPMPSRLPAVGAAAASEPDFDPCPSPTQHRQEVRLTADARLRLVYLHRKPLGVEVKAIRQGSLWSDLGLQDGEVILESNGRRLDRPQASLSLLRDLERADELELQVRTIDGRERWIDWKASPGSDSQTRPERCR